MPELPLDIPGNFGLEHACVYLLLQDIPQAQVGRAGIETEVAAQAPADPELAANLRMGRDAARGAAS